MAVYKVKEDGKAQSGLKKGDTVVTGGGTYEITGVNADGTYKSQKVSNENTSTFKGTYANSGGTTKNSPYTAPTLGDNWSSKVDYQAIINNAVANEDWVTAAKAEQLRNQKITGMGITEYNPTNLYSNYLKNNVNNNIDYGTVGQEQMANGASWQDVLDTYNARNHKAATTEGLEKYVNDDIQRMMWNYIQDNMKSQNQKEAQDQFNQWIAEYEQNNPKAEYDGKYDSRINSLLNEILNREDFSYSAETDPLYQQYADMYRREGERAMKNTMAEAAAGAGGMNTYAVTAAQQANSYYNSMLTDKIPELYQLAYEMYLNDKESKVQDLGILQNMDATQYNRYRDTINDYYADKNFAYNAYYDAIQQGNWQANYDYNKVIDDRNYNNEQYWKNKEFDYNEMWDNKYWEHNLERENIEDKRYEDVWNREQTWRDEDRAWEREQWDKENAWKQAYYDQDSIEFWATYNQNNDQFNKSLEFDYANLAQNDRQFNASLSQEDRHHNDNIAQGDRQFNASLSSDNKNSASKEVWNLVELGVMPSADLIASAGLNADDVTLAVNTVRAEYLAKGIALPSVGGVDSSGGTTPSSSSSSSSKSSSKSSSSKKSSGSGSGSGYKGGSSNFTAVSNACDELASQGNVYGAMAYATEAKKAGLVTQSEYDSLVNKHKKTLDVNIWDYSPDRVFGTK